MQDVGVFRYLRRPTVFPLTVLKETTVCYYLFEIVFLAGESGEWILGQEQFMKRCRAATEGANFCTEIAKFCTERAKFCAEGKHLYRDS